MLNNKKYDFFISYSRDMDLTIIEQLIFYLSEYNINIWYDRNEIILGSNIYTEFEYLLNEISNWKGCIVFFDKTYLFKEWCMKELNTILNKNLYLLPILYNINKSFLSEKDSRLTKYNYHTINKTNMITLVNKIIKVFILRTNTLKIKISHNEIWNILYNDYYTTSNNSGIKIIKADTLCSYIKAKYDLTEEQIRLMNIIKIKSKKYINEYFSTIEDISICNLIIEKLLDFS